MPSFSHLAFPSGSPVSHRVLITSRRNLTWSSTAPTPRAPSPPPSKRCSNWGRWGADDVLGTLNFLDDAKRARGRGAGPARRAASRCRSASTERPAEGLAPAHQPGAHDARHRAGRRARHQGFPHGSAAPTTSSSCRCRLDPVGRPRPHLRPRQRLERPPRRRRRHQRGRPRHRHRDRRRPDSPAAASCSTSAGRVGTDGELPDGFAITAEHLEATIAAQGESRTGRPRRHRAGAHRPAHPRPTRPGRRRAGATTPAAPRPACRSPPPTGCTAPRSPGSPPTPGASRCGPTSSTSPSSRCTRSRSRTSACSSARCGTSTRSPPTARPTACYDFWLTAAPLPVTGAVGAPVNPIAVK